MSKIKGGRNNASVKTLSTQITSEEHARYAKIAKMQGMTLSAWVKHTLSQLYPADLVMEPPRAGPSKVIDLPSAQAPKSVMGVADVPTTDTDPVESLEAGLYASAAEADRRELGIFSETVAPSSNTRRTAATVVSPRVPVASLGESPHGQHACAHLSSQPPPNMTWNDCQGTCINPRQRGRACQWPSQVANQCPVYRPKRSLPLAG